MLLIRASMPVRSAALARAASRALYTVDVVLLSARDRAFWVRCRPPMNARGAQSLLSTVPAPTESFEATARRLVWDASGIEPAWMEQLGAFRGDRHPLAVPLSIAYVAVVPTDREPFNKGTWIQVEPSAGPSGRQRLMLERALQRVRDQMDFVPIAFWFLPTSFTLSALQQTYELLLGQRVHKASFRRTLLVADLVEPLNDWQSDGPGRPAQLFRYAPGTGRAAHRGVRFDLLG